MFVLCSVRVFCVSVPVCMCLCFLCECLWCLCFMHVCRLSMSVCGCMCWCVSYIYICCVVCEMGVHLFTLLSYFPFINVMFTFKSMFHVHLLRKNENGQMHNINKFELKDDDHK